MIVTKLGLTDAGKRAGLVNRDGPIDSKEFLRNPIWWAGMITSKWSYSRIAQECETDGDGVLDLVAVGESQFVEDGFERAAKNPH